MNSRLMRALRGGHRALAIVEFRFDGLYPDAGVPLATTVRHGRWQDHLVSLANQPGNRVLEIGSREVTSTSDARRRFDKADYVGFDYYAGRNVDVVGDAHALSSHLGDGERFDLIYSSATFEHFAMPWVVAAEIAKLLNVGGHVFVETHFSFSSHERPWHFFQFSDMALRVLFSPEMGIECIEAGVSNPIMGRYTTKADAYLRHRPVPGLYCHTEFLGRKVRDVPDFAWERVRISEVVGGSEYPAPAAGILPGS